MNDQLQKALLALLNQTANGANDAVLFMQKELPDIIRQLLLWNAVKSGIFFLIWATAFGFGVKWWRYIYKSEDVGGEEAVPLYVALVIWFLMAAIGIAFSMDWLQILLAPKVYLLEYAKSVVVK